VIIYPRDLISLSHYFWNGGKPRIHREIRGIDASNTKGERDNSIGNF